MPQFIPLISIRSYRQTDRQTDRRIDRPGTDLSVGRGIKDMTHGLISSCYLVLKLLLFIYMSEIFFLINLSVEKKTQIYPEEWRMFFFIFISFSLNKNQDIYILIQRILIYSHTLTKNNDVIMAMTSWTDDWINVFIKYLLHSFPHNHIREVMKWVINLEFHQRLIKIRTLCR